MVDTLLRDMADCATVSMAMLPESPWLLDKLLSIGVAVQFNAGEIGQHAGPMTAYEYPDALLVKSSIHEDMASQFLSREQMHASAMKRDASSRGGTSRGGGGKRTRGGTNTAQPPPLDYIVSRFCSQPFPRAPGLPPVLP